MNCKKCGGAAVGWKCDMCGAEATEHVETHKCGGSHCMPKCEPCGEAEGLCKC